MNPHGIGNLYGQALQALGNAGLGWHDDGLCAQTDPEIFFPDKGGSVREPKQVCRACTVRVECLEYALENDDRFGVWGGFSREEREKAAPLYHAGVPARDLVDAADAEYYAREEHRSERERTYAAAVRARNAAKVAAAPPVPQPREVAA